MAKCVNSVRRLYVIFVVTSSIYFCCIVCDMCWQVFTKFVCDMISVGTYSCCFYCIVCDIWYKLSKAFAKQNLHARPRCCMTARSTFISSQKFISQTTIVQCSIGTYNK
jgi:hypothetical protein